MSGQLRSSGHSTALGHLDIVPEDGEVKALPCDDTGRQIIVAVDCRDGSHRAFDWALKHVAKPGDHIILLHVRQTPNAGPQMNEGGDAYALVMEQLMAKYSKEAREKYMVSCSQLIKSGDPREILLREVVVRDAVTLVLGCRGNGPVKRAFLGSISDYCARHAECPVIIIRGKTF